MLYNNLLDLLQHIYSSVYKKLNISMDSIFIQMHINWTRKDISINKIKDYNSDNLCQHVYKLEKPSSPPGTPPPQSSISRQQAHKEKSSLGIPQSDPKGQRDTDSSISKLRYQWTIVSLLFNFSSFNVSKGFLIQHSKEVMEGRI